MLKIGNKHTFSLAVTQENCASAIGSGGLDVFSTPSMITGMEVASFTCAQSDLDEGMTTVGTVVNIKHLAATPIGATVTFCAELIEIDDRRLVFDVQAHDNSGKIGEGTHERFIVHGEKFIAKINDKLKTEG